MNEPAPPSTLMHYAGCLLLMGAPFACIGVPVPNCWPFKTTPDAANDQLPEQPHNEPL